MKSLGWGMSKDNYTKKVFSRLRWEVIFDSFHTVHRIPKLYSMKPKMPEAQRDFEVISFSEIDQPKKGNFIIHMTGEEWQRAVKGISVVPFDPKLHSKLHGLAYRSVRPDRPERGVFAYPFCDNGDPCQVEIAKSHKFGRCDCPGGITPPSTGGTTGGSVTEPSCEISIDQNGFVTCTGIFCANPRPVRIEITVGGIVLFGFLACLPG